MFSSLVLASIYSAAYVVSAASTPPVTRATQPSVHLAVGPNCSSAHDSTTGLQSLSQFKTIVAFGDAFTYGGSQSGGALSPAVVVPPNPTAGGRYSNGPVWVEDLANNIGATLIDFADAGAVVDNTLYPASYSFSGACSFSDQIDLVLSGTIPDPDTTLYVVFFGEGDDVLSDGFTTVDPYTVASTVAYDSLLLLSSPIYAKNILYVDNTGLGTSTPAIELYKSTIQSSLPYLKSHFGVNNAFVDLSTLWDGVLYSPGYEAFGFTSLGPCITGNTTASECADPSHTFEWMQGYPSAATHQLISQYVAEVISQCQ